jgi:hypothetical protein
MAIVTDAAEKKKSPALTLAEAAFRALVPTAAGLVAGVSLIGGEAVPDWSRGSGGAPAPGSPDVGGAVEVDPPGSTGWPGSAGVVAVVVVVAVVPVSWAAEMAGTAQIAARTSIPLARALAPFTLRILRSIDS